MDKEDYIEKNRRMTRDRIARSAQHTGQENRRKTCLHCGVNYPISEFLLYDSILKYCSKCREKVPCKGCGESIPLHLYPNDSFYCLECINKKNSVQSEPSIQPTKIHFAENPIQSDHESIENIKCLNCGISIPPHVFYELNTQLCEECYKNAGIGFNKLKPKLESVFEQEEEISGKVYEYIEPEKIIEPNETQIYEVNTGNSRYGVEKKPIATKRAPVSYENRNTQTSHSGITYQKRKSSSNSAGSCCLGIIVFIILLFVLSIII